MLNPIVQTRFVVEKIKDPKCELQQIREKANAFLETHARPLSLDACLEDIRHQCKIENTESVDDLILKMSFEEPSLSVIVIFMQDAGEWNKTLGITKEDEDTHYTIYDPSTNESSTYQSLDVDVFNRLSMESIPSFGYLVLFFRKKKESVPPPPESIPLPPESVKTTKKRHRPLAVKKKPAASTVGETISEESANK